MSIRLLREVHNMTMSGISQTAEHVAVQTKQVAPVQTEAKAASPSTSDLVTISALGKTAVQQTAQYSPSEEQKESTTQKARETQAGKK
jgi:hypothetical protein